MKLRNFIKRSEYNGVRQFAEAAGLSHEAVYRVLRGKPVGALVARKIHAITNGKVRIADLVMGQAA